MEIQLYKQKYKGTKVTFNSRKGAGKTIEGIATQIEESLQIVILRDADNFPHCVSMISLQEI